MAPRIWPSLTELYIYIILSKISGFHGGSHLHSSAATHEGSYSAQRHLNQPGFHDKHEGRSGSQGRRREYPPAKYEEFKEPDPGKL